MSYKKYFCIVGGVKGTLLFHHSDVLHLTKMESFKLRVLEVILSDIQTMNLSICERYFVVSCALYLSSQELSQYNWPLQN
jgi:hypothetical protein